MTLDRHTFYTTLGRHTKIGLCITRKDEAMLPFQKTVKRPEIALRASALRKSQAFCDLGARPSGRRAGGGALALR